MKCYGFDLKNTDQCGAANQIIQDVNNFIFNGWKVARQIPKRIHGFDAFIKFMDDNLNHDSKSEYNSEEDVNDDDKKTSNMRLTTKRRWRKKQEKTKKRYRTKKWNKKS